MRTAKIARSQLEGPELARYATGALRAGGVHRLNDVGKQLLAELRRDLDRLDVGLDLVQVLQPQDVIVREVGNHPGEEEAERLQGGADTPGVGVRQREVDTDPVHPLPAQLA